MKELALTGKDKAYFIYLTFLFLHGIIKSNKQEENTMAFLYYTLFSIAIVVLDQVTKYLTVANIELFADIPFIPGLLQLTYVRNTGAAFSSFEGQQWLFAIVFIVFTGAILYEYFKKPMPFSKLERWCIAAVYGGGLGNMIDRVRLGYVVDMIETTFIKFPVFNVADCFITCGCILLMVSLFLFNKEFWKEEKK
jgi:signal peptidase II